MIFTNPRANAAAEALARGFATKSARLGKDTRSLTP